MIEAERHVSERDEREHHEVMRFMLNRLRMRARTRAIRRLARLLTELDALAAPRRA